MASNLLANGLLAMAGNLVAMACNLLAMASNLLAYVQSWLIHRKDTPKCTTNIGNGTKPTPLFPKGHLWEAHQKESQEFHVLTAKVLDVNAGATVGQLPGWRSTSCPFENRSLSNPLRSRHICGIHPNSLRIVHPFHRLISS